jgi:prophage antirepressor-like protein
MPTPPTAPLTFGAIRRETFEGHLVHLIEVGPNRVPTVLLTEQANALEYADPRTLNRLVRDLTARGEMKPDRHFLRLGSEDTGRLMAAFAVAFPDTANPLSSMTREVILLTRMGVIRAAMRAETPKASQYRDWAEVVLFEVMETGRYQEGLAPTDASDVPPPDVLAAVRVSLQAAREARRYRETRAHALPLVAQALRWLGRPVVLDAEAASAQRPLFRVVPAVETPAAP